MHVVAVLAVVVYTASDDPPSWNQSLGKIDVRRFRILFIRQEEMKKEQFF